MPSLSEILSEQRIPHALGGSHRHVRRGWMGIDCPRCGRNSGKFHAAIHLGTLRSHCWKCGRLDTVTLLMDVSGQPFRVVKGWVGTADRLGPAQRIRPLTHLKVPGGLGALLPAHRAYLMRRHYDPEELERLWDLQGIGLAANLSWRIFIPCFLDGQMVSWTTRSIGNAPQRYLNAPPDHESIPLKELLGGEDYCCQAVVVCEGPFDAMRIGPGAVWTGGLGISVSQLLRISKYPNRTICFDNESEAQRRAGTVASMLAGYPGTTTVARIESGKDAAEADEDEIKEIRARFLLQ